ncbi:hypothetical protein BDY19DRAFT_907924 [Irpex rosettiformis]|uniref:Uncharacterized protein n=1 Tax=Irpex rosettiformis TaxID=378272 RepID=A0ACB8TXE4_9APHY|nr:hypothetical protein BDY19DRAFT_907924 [Irpex rosettiformis]
MLRTRNGWNATSVVMTFWLLAGSQRKTGEIRRAVRTLVSPTSPVARLPLTSAYIEVPLVIAKYTPVRKVIDVLKLLGAQLKQSTLLPARLCVIFSIWGAEVLNFKFKESLAQYQSSTIAYRYLATLLVILCYNHHHPYIKLETIAEFKPQKAYHHTMRCDTRQSAFKAKVQSMITDGVPIHIEYHVSDPDIGCRLYSSTDDPLYSGENI